MSKTIKSKRKEKESDAPDDSCQKLRKDLLKMILRNEQKRTVNRTVKKRTG